MNVRAWEVAEHMRDLLEVMPYEFDKYYNEIVDIKGIMYANVCEDLARAMIAGWDIEDL